MDPVFILKLEGKSISNSVMERLTSWDLEDVEKTDKLILTFDNYDFSIENDPFFELGALISFRHGYVGEMSKERFFTVGMCKGWQEIRLEALSVTNVFNNCSANRRFFEAPLEIVVSEIADANGLKYKTQERTDATGASLLFDYFQPNNITDMQFLYTLGRNIGYEVWVEAGILYFMPRMYWQAPYMEFFYEGIGGQVLDFKPKMNTMNRRGKFAGGGVDLEKKESFFVTEKGKTTRMTYLGKRFLDYEKMRQRYKELKQARLVRVPMKNRKQAEDIMAGAYIKEMEDQITADLVLIGQPHLTARRVIQVNNVGKYTGKYYVRSVSHSGKDGYTSTAHLTRNASFDKGGKYSRENVDSLVNKQRVSLAEYKAQVKKAKHKTFGKIRV